MSTVNVEGIDKVALLKPATFFAMSGTKPPDDEELLKAVNLGNVDYLNGRVIKVHFDQYPNIDPWGYDRDNGVGALERVANSLR